MKRVKLRRLEAEVEGDGLHVRLVALDAETDGDGALALSDLIGSMLRTGQSGGSISVTPIPTSTEPTPEKEALPPHSNKSGGSELPRHKVCALADQVVRQQSGFPWYCQRCRVPFDRDGVL